MNAFSHPFTTADRLPDIIRMSELPSNLSSTVNYKYKKNFFKWIKD
jgi:hypothetical protein